MAQSDVGGLGKCGQCRRWWSSLRLGIYQVFYTFIYSYIDIFMHFISLYIWWLCIFVRLIVCSITSGVCMMHTFHTKYFHIHKIYSSRIVVNMLLHFSFSWHTTFPHWGKHGWHNFTKHLNYIRWKKETLKHQVSDTKQAKY